MRAIRPLRECTVGAIVVLAVVSCARPAPPSAGQPSDAFSTNSTSASPSTASTSAAPSIPEPQQPPPKTGQSATGPYVLHYDATCHSPQPMSEWVSEVRNDETMSWVTGTVETTDRTIMSPTFEHLVLTQLIVRIDRGVAGRQLAVNEPIETYVPGGTYQEEAQTVAGSTSAVAWGPKGRFFGALFASEDVPATGLGLIALPLIEEDAIVSTGAGCTTFPPPHGKTLTTSATLFVDGSPRPISGTFPAQSLSELTEQIRTIK